VIRVIVIKAFATGARISEFDDDPKFGMSVAPRECAGSSGIDS
jgi:hypothetical protein